MKTVVFITGGERSGKSRHALSLALSLGHKRAFVATAQAVDEEMKQRIDHHKAERGDAFFTVEEPLDLVKALTSLPKETDVAVVDCLTVWLGNLMHHHGSSEFGASAVEGFISLLSSPPCHLIIVSNEVGLGLIPDNQMARVFRDQAGRLNQKVADQADDVIFMVSGIPLVLKGKGSQRCH